MKLILHLVSVKNVTFKSSYNWFKIDILRLLRPPTAIFSHVHSHLNYFMYNVKLKLCAKHVSAIMEPPPPTPPPLNGKCHEKCPYVLTPSLMAKVLKKIRLFFNTSPNKQAILKVLRLFTNRLLPLPRLIIMSKTWLAKNAGPLLTFIKSFHCKGF